MTVAAVIALARYLALLFRVRHRDIGGGLWSDLPGLLVQRHTSLAKDAYDGGPKFRRWTQLRRWWRRWWCRYLRLGRRVHLHLATPFAVHRRDIASRVPNKRAGSHDLTRLHLFEDDVIGRWLRALVDLKTNAARAALPMDHIARLRWRGQE